MLFRSYVAWVQLPKRISALKLYRLALESKITIAPGIIFAGEPRYENCFRLNYGQPWSSRLEDALQLVGAMASSIA